ncbi:iron uptake protein [Variovorax sp. UMC13]|uniref:iron uptake protein n=1 Tax=Variovorax sp. UMC13 TaxID=1862326 RepID=UPI0015FF6BB5|nr:iron uptake protein [Variovorax sp. UMC13]MBB1601821.1 iron uptake protein [Variovorax sp. UMC13]
MTASTLSRVHLASRIAAGMLGGYAFTWGFIALLIGLLFAAKMEFHDAEALGYILGFIVFLGVFLWAFSARSLARVWLVLAGGGALMSGAAWLVQRALV